MSEVKRFIEVLKNKFYRNDNVWYPAHFAERMMEEAYEDFIASNADKAKFKGEEDER